MISVQGPDGEKPEDDGRPSENLVPEQENKMEVSRQWTISFPNIWLFIEFNIDGNGGNR